MNFGKGLLFLGGYMSVAMVQAEAELQARQLAPAATPKAVVQGFLEIVRAGVHPERAKQFMAPQVLAHQLNAEAPADVLRTPDEYAQHIDEFKHSYGAFDLEVTELIADGDRVYARWRQTGCHIAAVDGYAPTRRKVVELASAVYRVVDGRIVEYWIQVDRAGTEAQLRANKTQPVLSACA
jgi:predicted ester cyclase